MPTVTLALSARELADLRAVVRDHRRTHGAGPDELQRFRATRLASLAPRLTDALDSLPVNVNEAV